MTSVEYEVFDDPYCYPGTLCLKNRIGLTEHELLEAFEVEMTTLRAEESLPDGRFTPSHYRKIHRHLFQDVYTWAGRYRTIRIGKGGNWFCYPEYIKPQMDRLFRRLQSQSFRNGATGADFVSAAAEFLAELNAIHPFRDGNGRTQLTFMHLLSLRVGLPMSFENIDRDSFLVAMIASFAGNFGPLTAELSRLRV